MWGARRSLSLLARALVDWKKSRTSKTEEPPSQPANWQVNQQANEHFDSSNILKRFKEIHITEHNHYEHLISNITSSKAEHRKPNINRTKSNRKNLFEERTRANKQAREQTANTSRELIYLMNKWVYRVGSTIYILLEQLPLKITLLHYGIIKYIFPFGWRLNIFQGHGML